MQDDDLPAGKKSLLVVPELCVVPANVVQRTGLPAAVPGGPEQAERLLRVVQGLGIAASLAAHDGEVEVRQALPGLVLGLAVQVEALPQVSLGVVETALLSAGARETAVSVGLRQGIAEPAGSGQGGALGGCLVVPESPPVEEIPQGPGQLPGVGVPGRIGAINGGEQHHVLGGEPGQRLLMVARYLRRDTGLRRGESDQVLGRVKQLVGGMRVMQVVVEDPVDRRVPVAVGVDLAGLPGSVGAQQVVAGVPARTALADQVRPGELSQQGPDVSQGQAREAGRGWGGDVGSGMQAEQPEQARLAGI